MVKVAAPALSLEASGSIGKIMTFSKWKGRPYVRSLVRPSNPKTGGQTGVRSIFKFLAQAWATIGAVAQATWEDRADQKVVSTFNAFMSYNQSRFRDFLAPSTSDPAEATDTPAVTGAIAAVAGVRSATLTIPITTANDGWGVMAFRSTSTGFTTAFDNLIGVGTIDGTDDVVIVDTPLDPGDYYYNFREFTLDGQLGAELGEETITIA
jgi:hypothetical protein